MATVEFVSFLLRKLQAKDESAVQLLRSRSLWIIPSTNPDPYDSNIRSKRVIVTPRTNRIRSQAKEWKTHVRGDADTRVFVMGACYVDVTKKTESI